MKFLIVHFSPFHCYVVCLRPKCPSQHRSVERPQPMFLPQCEIPIFSQLSYGSMYT